MLQQKLKFFLDSQDPEVMYDCIMQIQGRLKFLSHFGVQLNHSLMIKDLLLLIVVDMEQFAILC